MIQFLVKYVFRHTPNESFQFVTLPVREYLYQEMDVVHVQVEIVHHAIIRGEI